MFTSFEAKNFRGFRDLVISDLSRVNLIAGMNNVGKTALLEALFIHSGAYNPELALTVNAFRGIGEVRVEFKKTSEFPWSSLFNLFEPQQNIVLRSESPTEGTRVLRLSEVTPDQISVGPRKGERKERKGPSPKLIAAPQISVRARVLRLECEEKRGKSNYDLIWDPAEPSGSPFIRPTPPEPPSPAFFLAGRGRIPFEEEADLFGKLEIKKKQDVLVQFLRIIEPNLEDIRVIYTLGKPIFYGDLGEDRLFPLHIMGEGMVRLASLVLRIANAPKGVILVDEIENGLHHSIHQKLWKALAEVARNQDTQIIATTHSLECIKAAHKAFSGENTYDFRVHILQSTKEGIQATTYGQEDLETAFEIGLEVR